MTKRYQCAKTGTGQYGRYLTLSETMSFLRQKVSPDGGVRLKKGQGNDLGPILTRFEALKRLRAWLDKEAEPGDKATIFPDTGPTNWSVRTAVYNPLPTSFLVGVPSIDRIATDVFDRFNDTYGITNLGICVNKAGEHGECNAVDFGVSKPTTSAAIHNAILDVGNYLRNRMLADIEGEPGLPVNGVIVMEQICSRSNTSWYHYNGVPHVSHLHASGWPNLVPGWV